MSHASLSPVRCGQPGCTASYPGSKHAAIRAQEQGWFSQRDGASWCPDHVPSWVASWRARQKG